MNKYRRGGTWNWACRARGGSRGSCRKGYARPRRRGCGACWPSRHCSQGDIHISVSPPLLWGVYTYGVEEGGADDVARAATAFSL